MTHVRRRSKITKRAEKNANIMLISLGIKFVGIIIKFLFPFMLFLSRTQVKQV